MTRLGRWVLVLMVGCLLPTMAGASTSAPGARAPVAPNARYVQLTVRLDLRGTGITLRPPPPGVAPPITGQQAFQTCVTGHSLCDPALSPNVYLALADEPENGMVGRLVWILDFPGSSCVPLGNPPVGPGHPALLKRAITPYPCRLVNLLDSNTGRLLWAVRF